jgi:hypothetical protein
MRNIFMVCTAIDVILILPGAYLLFALATLNFFSWFHWGVVPVILFPILCVCAPLLGWKFYNRSKAIAAALVLIPILWTFVVVKAV